jgi:hypothetical protein
MVPLCLSLAPTTHPAASLLRSSVSLTHGFFAFLFFFPTSVMCSPIHQSPSQPIHLLSKRDRIPLPPILSPFPTKRKPRSLAMGTHTRRQTLLQLICLIRILQHERIQEPVTPDLEFDVGGLGGFLDARGWNRRPEMSVTRSLSHSVCIAGKKKGRVLAS